MGGSDDAGVEADRPGATQAGEVAFLQHAQEAPLQLQGHVADLVEEQGATPGQFELARRTAPAPTGEGAVFIAKELRFDQPGRQGRTIDRHEGAGGPVALVVQAAGQDFLAGAGFAVNEHRDVALEGPAGDVQGAPGGAVNPGAEGAGGRATVVGVAQGPHGVADPGQQGAPVAGLEAGLEAQAVVVPQRALGDPAGQGLVEGFGRAVEELAETGAAVPFGDEVQQLAGCLIGAQQLPRVVKDHHARQRCGQQLRTGVETQAQGAPQIVQHAVLDGPGGDGQGFEHRDRAAVTVAGGVEDARQLPGRIEQGHRGAGKGADLVEEMLGGADHDGLALDQGAAQAVGADVALQDGAADLEDLVQAIK